MKKVFGYVFLVCGSILGLALFAHLISTLSSVTQMVAEGGSYNMGYLLGKFLVDFIYAGIIFLLMRTGSRWTKKTKKDHVVKDVIDSDLIEK